MERVINYTEARRNLKSALDAAVDDRVTIVITRKAGEPVVMMAKSELDAILDTFHLIRSPANAQRLRDAIAEVDRGEALPVKIVDGFVEEQ